MARTAPGLFGAPSISSTFLRQVECLLALFAIITAAQECDVVSSGPVCLNSGSTVLKPRPAAPGLGGHWNFDGPKALDLSGRGNHGIGTVEHGPAPAGAGYSAILGKKHLMVPDSETFKTMDFSYSFWIYVLDDAVGQAKEAPRWCPILRKGMYITSVEAFANNPGIFYSRNTGHLRAAMTTSVSKRGDGEFVDSNARVLRNRWVHVAIVHHGPTVTGGEPRLLLYVNGILDAKLDLRGMPEQNDYPIYVGGDPFTEKQCSFQMYMDDLRMYTRAVTPHELQAEAAPAFAGVEPSFVHLGCLKCSLEEAMHGCPPNRHVCSSIELHTGGYQVAKALGWLLPASHVWTQAAVKKAQAAARTPTAGDEALAAGSLTQSPGVGLSLCCEGPA